MIILRNSRIEEDLNQQIKAENCDILETVNIPANSELINCRFLNATLDFSGNSDIGNFIINAHGNLTIDNLISGAEIHIYGTGLKLIVSYNCTLGNIYVFGDVNVSNYSSANVYDFTLYKDLGDASESQLGSILNILGDPAAPLADRIGDPDSDILPNLVEKLGNLARSLNDQLGDRWSSSGTISDDITYLCSHLIKLNRVQSGTQSTNNTLTTVGSEIEDTAPFKASGFISLHNMQPGDTFLLIEEIRDYDDNTYREYERKSYSDEQINPMIYFNPKNCLGWRIRIQRTAGSDREISYQFFKESY